MLEPCRMSRILVTGPKKVQVSVIRELHRLKLLHIVEHAKTELADIGKPLENASNLSGLIIQVRALITSLGLPRSKDEARLKGGLLEIRQVIEKLNIQVNGLLENLRKAEEFNSKNHALMKELEILTNINVPLEAFSPYRSLVYFMGWLDAGNVASFKGELSKITENFMVFDCIIKRRIFIALFLDAKSKESADGLLGKIGFSPINFSNIGGLKGDAEANLKKAEIIARNTEKLIEKAKKQLNELGTSFINFLQAAEEFLEQELEKAEAPLRFAATKDAFLVKGWVPSENLNVAIEKLNKSGGNKLYIHSEPAKHEDKVPVKLKNAQYAKPFEFFINMYSLPKYHEFDPTFFMFLAFPIFFGFMLGDFGYGIVSFALFYFLKKKIPKVSSLFNILMLSSISSIFFGLIYGEFFGFEEIGHFVIPHLISRTHEITEMMYIAVAIGIVHINWGLVSGFINMKKAHGLKHAVFEKASWFVLEIGILLLALSYMNIAAIPKFAGWIFFIVSVIMLYKGEGIKGIIELPTILTNTLSYLRLMAIGLSSASIAVVVNEMASGFFREGGLLILAGILVMLVGHVLNIVLGLFGSFLHSMRLHYVEFFSKFFEGGAEKYKPFGAKEQ